MKRLSKLKKTKPGNHEYCAYQTDKKIMCQSLRGKCLVNMLSIFVAHRLMMVAGYGKKKLIYSVKPEVVLGYRSFMRGVDKVHQFLPVLVSQQSHIDGEKELFFWLAKLPL
jgi:hypothetical protein